MRVVDIRTRGQNLFFSTDDGTSVVVRGDLTELGIGTEVFFNKTDLTAVIKDVTFNARYDEYQNTYDLSLPDVAVTE